MRRIATNKTIVVVALLAFLLLPAVAMVALSDEPTHPRYPRLLLVSAAWCEPCQAIKHTKRSDGLTDFEWLQKEKWQIDETDRAHLQIIDLDKDQSYRVDKIPMVVLLGPDGNEVARAVYHGRQTFGELLKKLESKPKVAMSRSEP